jgi:hypothetical protein
MDPQILLLAGITLMLFVLLRNLVRRTKGKKKNSIKKQLTESRSHFKSRDARGDTPLIDAPALIGRWQVEMHQTARDLRAELDSKILVLQAVIKSAREETMRLENAIQTAKNE